MDRPLSEKNIVASQSGDLTPSRPAGPPITPAPVQALAESSKSDLLPPEEDLIDGTLSHQEYIEIGDNFAHNYLVGRCRLAPDGAVLDIGSGNGQKARALTRYLNRNGRYEGFDIVPSAVDWCAQTYAAAGFANFRFQHARLFSDWYNLEAADRAETYRFPYEDETFDVAFMSSVATHLLPEALLNYLREARRVLKPGGRLLTTFFLMTSEAEQLKSHTPVQGSQFVPLEPEIWTNSLEQPSRGVCYGERLARRLHAAAELRVAEMTFGTWSGPDVVCALQDTILAVRP